MGCDLPDFLPSLQTLGTHARRTLGIYQALEGLLLISEVSDHRFVKEHSGVKDALEAVHKTAISFPVFEQAEEIAHFERGPLAPDTAAPTNGNGRHPDGN